MRKWIARFSFSLFALAFVLAWQGYRLQAVQGQSTRVTASYLGAALCLGMGLAGVRERHRD